MLRYRDKPVVVSVQSVDLMFQEAEMHISFRSFDERTSGGAVIFMIEDFRYPGQS